MTDLLQEGEGDVEGQTDFVQSIAQLLNGKG